MNSEYSCRSSSTRSVGKQLLALRRAAYQRSLKHNFDITGTEADNLLMFQQDFMSATRSAFDPHESMHAHMGPASKFMQGLQPSKTLSKFQTTPLPKLARETCKRLAGEGGVESCETLDASPGQGKNITS